MERSEDLALSESEDLLSTATAAAIAKRSIRTIRRAYRSGELLAYRDGGGRGIRIRRADLHDWLLRERVEPRVRGGQASTSPRGPTHEPGENLALLRAARARSS